MSKSLVIHGQLSLLFLIKSDHYPTFLLFMTWIFSESPSSDKMEFQFRITYWISYFSYSFLNRLLSPIYSTARTYPQNPEKSAFSATFSQLCTHARNMSRILYFCSYSSSLVKWAFFDCKSPIEFDGMRTNFSTLASEAVESLGILNNF